MDQSVSRIRARFPNKVPCLVKYNEHTMKFILPTDLTYAELSMHVRKQIAEKGYSDGSKSRAYFLMRDSSMPQGTMTVGEDTKDLTGALELHCREENVFG